MDRIVGRSFLREHILRPSSVSEYGILEMLESVGLSKTALNVRPFVKIVVLEFYANLSNVIGDVTSDEVFRAYIHGHTIDFSPHVINNYLRFVPPREPILSIDLNVLITKLIGGLITSWGKNGLRASASTTKYSIPHKIGMRN